ncbi:MAG: radical SAM protein, partial [Actinobacteria bacterium]
MPEGGVEQLPHEHILTLEEIERFAALAVEQGIGKIRLTGGEPLVRFGVVDHVRRLRAITGLEDIALTTNGTLLAKYASDLYDAGLRRVNVSLDSLDAEVYARVTRGGVLADALAGIDAAFDAGFEPVKVNVVVVRSLEQDLLAFARMTLERPLHVRFIEYMPVGEVESGAGCHAETSAGWTPGDTVPSRAVIERLAAAGAAA